MHTFHRLTLERLEAIPGVASASISSFTPFFNWSDIRKYLVAGRDLPQPGQEPAAVGEQRQRALFRDFRHAHPFGRAFTEPISSRRRRFSSLARRWRGPLRRENPIGRRIAQTVIGSPQWGEIVGVAADVKSVMPIQGR